jgi:hypothetical protein
MDILRIHMHIIGFRMAKDSTTMAWLNTKIGYKTETIQDHHTLLVMALMLPQMLALAADITMAVAL